MITAVYIVSPGDDLGNVPQFAQKEEYDGRSVFVMRQGATVRTVVFADGAPGILKRNLEQGLDCASQMSELYMRLEGLLRRVGVSSADVRAFIHFGGQGLGDLKKFNKRLSVMSTVGGSFRCYAISFGNYYPLRLFKERVFSPPDGEEFRRMLEELQRQVLGSFEHFRATRILMENCMPDENGLYDCSGCRFAPKDFSKAEREGLDNDVDLRKLYRVGEFRWRNGLTEDEFKVAKNRLSERGG